MDTSRISSAAVELLERLTGLTLSKQEIAPPVIFLAAWVTISVGVMAADGKVKEEEERLLATTIERLVPQKGNDISQFMELLMAGIRENPIYNDSNEWLKLASLLSVPEKTLLISFCYEMSAVDGEIHPREREYLQEAANLLGIDSRYPAVLEAGFSGQGMKDAPAWDDLQALIHPNRFEALDIVFVEAARYILDALEVLNL